MMCESAEGYSAEELSPLAIGQVSGIRKRMTSAFIQISFVGLLRWCAPTCLSLASIVLQNSQVLRRYPESATGCGSVRHLIEGQQAVEVPRGHRLVKQSARAEDASGILDQIKRQAP